MSKKPGAVFPRSKEGQSWKETDTMTLMLCFVFKEVFGVDIFLQTFVNFTNLSRDCYDGHAQFTIERILQVH